MKLKKLDENNDKRRKIAQYYDKNFKDLNMIIPVKNTFSKHVYHQYVVQLENRDELKIHSNTYFRTYRYGFGIISRLEEESGDSRYGGCFDFETSVSRCRIGSLENVDRGDDINVWHRRRERIETRFLTMETS